jgi:cobalamin biosynthesis protein CobD/CbiB
MLDPLAIGVTAFTVVVMIGALIFEHHVNKVIEKAQKEDLRTEKEKQEVTRKQKSRKQQYK